MKPLTTKQKQAICRGRAMFLIKGAVVQLKSVKENCFRSYLLKGMINSAIITLERLLEHMKSSRYSSYETYLNDFYSSKKEKDNEQRYKVFYKAFYAFRFSRISTC